MDSLYVIRERMQDLYSRYSIVADKAIQFVLAVMTFYMINNNVGFMKTLASPVVALALAIIATFFPPIITVILATALILVHMYSVSIAALVVTALIFLIMYIFYLRFTPKMAIVVLLTPLAFALKIPVVVPISCALLLSPISMVAVGCGTVVYYMMAYMKKAASGMQGGSVKGMMGQIGKYAKQVFQNKELWIVLVAFIICTLVVYTLRKQAIAHAWTIAVITGAVVNIVVVAIGDVAMGVHASYGSLIFGSIGAAVIGVILELFFFSVDYSRSENLQYEDDEYYYYVKAVPKVGVTVPEKTVQQINKREEYPSETEVIDAKELRKKTQQHAQKDAAKKHVRKETPSHAAQESVRHAKKQQAGQERKQVRPRKTVDRQQPNPKKAAVKRKPSPQKRQLSDADTEHLLLTQSLEKELNLNKDNK